MSVGTSILSLSWTLVTFYSVRDLLASRLIFILVSQALQVWTHFTHPCILHRAWTDIGTWEVPNSRGKPLCVAFQQLAAFFGQYWQLW